MLILLAIVLGFATSNSGSERTTTLPTAFGEDKITFDPARISENEVRRLMQLSPNVSPLYHYSVPEWLELCSQREPAYKECGTRDWKADNFVYNANINLQRIRERIEKLQEPLYPAELRPVVSYFKRIQEYALFFQGRRLKFIQEGRAVDLAAPFDRIDPGKQCANEIAEIRAAPDKQTAYKLALNGWGNCVNRSFRTKVGKYPKAAWEEFLQRFSIREELLEETD